MTEVLTDAQIDEWRKFLETPMDINDRDELVKRAIMARALVYDVQYVRLQLREMLDVKLGKGNP